ncbi:hypothetical protein KIN20_018150 [Parelaphostrongylus tenuis]|uniref:Uncharacterized protein n=1 Tax=Parelaphostrongylus tenuis TaxID=148309 RepID=A0AAD5QU65_PARTN|nr:hypothetical protein KIN20_018150 [Parelaphostrongylus tenuis]
MVALRPMTDTQVAMDDKCIIVNNTVTGICTKLMAGARRPGMMCNMPVVIRAIPPPHLTIGGTISTTNIIMANWSRTMWQSVVNRAMRMLALGPFGSNFFSASAVVGGS